MEPIKFQFLGLAIEAKPDTGEVSMRIDENSKVTSMKIYPSTEKQKVVVFSPTVKQIERYIELNEKDVKHISTKSETFTPTETHIPTKIQSSLSEPQRMVYNVLAELDAKEMGNPVSLKKIMAHASNMARPVLNSHLYELQRLGFVVRSSSLPNGADPHWSLKK